MPHPTSRPHRRAALAGAASLLAIALATPAFAQEHAGDARPPRRGAGDRRHRDQARDLAARRALLDQRPDRGGIQRSGANTIEDLSRNVAGLTIQNLGPGQSQVSVRGVSAGQIVRDQPGVKEQVGVYLDESVISLSLFTPDLDLYDLNRVETLRGPQGTLFGSGSVGGTIRYITNQPELEPSRRLDRRQSQRRRPAAISAATSRAWSTCRSATRRRCARSAITPNMPASSTPGARAAASTRTSMTATAPAAASPSASSQRAAHDHPAHPLPGDPRQRLQPAGGLQPLRQPVHHRRRRPPPIQLGERQQYLLLREKLRRRHLPRRPQRQRRSRPGRR